MFLKFVAFIACFVFTLPLRSILLHVLIEKESYDEDPVAHNIAAYISAFLILFFIWAKFIF
jgi:hypothetical protein